MTRAVLTLNAGSSSLKFALFGLSEHDLSPESLVVLARGQIEGLGTAPHLIARDQTGAVVEETQWSQDAHLTHETFLASVMGFCERHLGSAELVAVGHRIVHGGGHFTGPVKLDADVLDALEALDILAPLHQPHNLTAARASAAARPDVPQVGVFDTAFHQTISPTLQRFGLPRALEAQGIRRYGFHGLSYEWLTRRLQAVDPGLAAGKVILAHLGAGASLCAIRNGHSIETTMGFSTLDGLMMATRCGALDPGVVLHLMTAGTMSPGEVSDLLYKQSGLLGVSGISGDMRTLLQSEAPEAREAVDLYTWRVAREIGSLTMALGGLDGLVFSAGIGENARDVRQRIVDRLAWMGARLDENGASGERAISSSDSRIKILVIPTDEERVIAVAALSVVS
jgi:acetate kinase